MSDPKTIDEYNDRFAKAHRISGHGFDVTVHMPCPACAAADFAAFKVIDTETALDKPMRCNACGRSFRVITTHPTEGSTVSEIVCTGGPELPSWAPYRRVDCDRPTERDLSGD